jgi:hypothetical protein
MEAVGIVLNIGNEHAEAFEQGFRKHEYPVWEDFVGRGVMLHATLTRMSISTQPRSGVTQYLLSVTFADDRGHHLHDDDPRFQEWNDIADAFQVAPPLVTGGEIILSAGIDEARSTA